MLKRFFLGLLTLGTLSACTEIELASHLVKNIPLPDTPRTQGTFKVGNPYEIFGKQYFPKESYTLVETGIASWYGPQFHGKQTANGEIFDMYELTAAHRTLQMPSLVKVTNLDNGLSLIVRVNDRGPYKRGRIIDLSKRSAELLGFKNQGTAKVRVEVLAPESRAIAEAAKRGEDVSGIEVAMNENRLDARRRLEEKAKEDEQPTAVVRPVSTQTVENAPVELVEIQPTAGLKPSIPGRMQAGNFLPDPLISETAVLPTNIFVQAGAFSNQDNAMRLASYLEGFGQADVHHAVVNGQNFYRVRFGPLSSVDKADQILTALLDSGRREAMIVVE